MFFVFFFFALLLAFTPLLTFILLFLLSCCCFLFLHYCFLPSDVALCLWLLFLVFMPQLFLAFKLFFCLSSCHYFLIFINVVCFCVVTSFFIATSCLYTHVLQYCLNILFLFFLLSLCFSSCCYFLPLCCYYYTPRFMLFKLVLLLFAFYKFGTFLGDN